MEEKMSASLFFNPVVKSADDAFYDAAHDIDNETAWDEDTVSQRIERHIERHRAQFYVDERYASLYAWSYPTDYLGWVKALRERQEMLAAGPGCHVIGLPQRSFAEAVAA
jgi:hypothetical protein